jgi:hypothetical protein
MLPLKSRILTILSSGLIDPAAHEYARNLTNSDLIRILNSGSVVVGYNITKQLSLVEVIRVVLACHSLLLACSARRSLLIFEKSRYRHSSAYPSD